MFIRISQREAKKLVQEHKVDLEFVKVNPICIRTGIFITYLNSSKAPDKKDGFFLQID